MSSLGQGWNVKLSRSIIVPTGSAFLATSTLGPSGTAGAAAACCAPAPANIFLAMTAVITAMTKAPMSRASFFTFMARSPPLDGLSEQPHTSDKLVKKPLGENRETTECDRDSVRNLRASLAAFGAVPGKNAQGQNAARERHDDQELDRVDGREPQRESSRELDVAAAHHAGIECSGENREDGNRGSQLDCNSGPRRQGDRRPIDGCEQRHREVQSVRNREGANVDHRRDDEDRGKPGEQDFGKRRVDH